MNSRNQDTNSLEINLSPEQNFLYLPKSIEKKYFASPADFDPADSIFEIIIKNLKKDTKVLDVGCSYGYFGNYLKRKLNCRVYGLEMDGEAVDYAKSHGSYSDIFCSDIETLAGDLDELTQRGFNEFDVVVCADILEHTKNINEITLALLQLLTEGGSLLISVPNIGHVDIVFNLINSNFNYSPFGILDNSHLRFFTKNSFIQWITLLGKDHGLEFEIELIGQTHIEKIYQSERNENDPRHLKRKKLLDLYNEIGGSKEHFVYQNVFKIKPLRAHILCREGERFFKQGNIEKAITSFREAISVDPKCAMTHNNLAAAYHGKGELGKAIEHLTTALSLEPENRDVVWNCGQIFLEIGQIDSALEIYQTFLTKYPDDHDFKEIVGELTRY